MKTLLNFSCILHKNIDFGIFIHLTTSSNEIWFTWDIVKTVILDLDEAGECDDKKYVIEFSPTT